VVESYLTRISKRLIFGDSGNDDRGTVIEKRVWKRI